MKVYACPLEALPDTLSNSGARHLVSLSGPVKALSQPNGLDAFLALEFNDIAEPRDGLIAPAPRDVSTIIDFVNAVPKGSPIVFQCWMGISRSTAALIIAALVLRPKASPRNIVQALRHHAPEATPNPLMIEHADTLLERDGQLIQAVEDIGRGAEAGIGKPFSIDLEALA